MSDSHKVDVSALPGRYVLHLPTGVCGNVREVWASGESGWLRGKDPASEVKIRKVTAEDVPGAADSEGRRFVLCTSPVVVFDSGHKLLCRAGEESGFQALTVDERIFFEMAKDRIRRTLGELNDTNEALRLAEKRAAFFCALALRDVMKP